MQINAKYTLHQIKVLLLVPVFGVATNACRTTNANTFVQTYEKSKVLLKDAVSGEERMIDCAPDSRIVSDLPYFKEGDPVTVNAINYDKHRFFTVGKTILTYNPDSIQIRKDQEMINKVKQKSR